MKGALVDRAPGIRARIVLLALAAGLLTADVAYATFPGHNGVIAFTRVDDPPVGVDCPSESLYTVALEGGAPTMLVERGCAPHAVTARSPTWSPDGRRVLFVGAGWETIRPDGSGRQSFEAPAFGAEPAYSPDGRLVAYTQVVPDNGVGMLGIEESVTYVWTARPDGTQRRRLSRGFSPAWSPDGRRIAYVRSDECPRTGGSDEGAYRRLRIWIMGRDGRHKRPFAPRRAARRGCGSSAPDWSPDGHRFVFTRSDGIHVARVDGSGRWRRLFARPDVYQPNPVWSPDGRKIAFRAHHAADIGTGDIYVINADGSGVRFVAPGGEDPAWQRMRARAPALRRPRRCAGRRVLVHDGVWIVSHRHGRSLALSFCDRTGGRRPVFRSDGQSYEPEVRAVAATRRYLAYELSYLSDASASAQRVHRVVVRRRSTGAIKFDVPLRLSLSDPRAAERIVLRDDGAVAWSDRAVANRFDPGAAQYRIDRIVKREVGATAETVLEQQIVSGADRTQIDLPSLHLRGSTLSWRSGGALKTAVLSQGSPH